MCYKKMFDTKSVMYEALLWKNIDSYLVSSSKIEENCELFLIKQKRSQKYDKAIVQECKYGNLKNVRFLVEKWKDISFNEYEPFRVASEYGQLKIVKYLYKIGVDIHAEYDYAFRYAGTNKHWDVVKFLIEKGANVSSNNDEVFKYACSNNQKEIVRMMIDRGVDFNYYSAYMRNLLIKENIDLIKYIVIKNKSFFCFDRSYIISLGDVELYKMMQDKFKDNTDEVHEAIYSGSLEMVKYILNKHVIDFDKDVMSLSYCRSKEILSYVIGLLKPNKEQMVELIEKASLHDSIEITRYLVELLGDISGKLFSNLILNLVEYTQYELIDFFVKKGVEIPDDILKYCKTLKMTKYMIDFGACIEYDNFRAIRSALVYDKYDIWQYLVNKVGIDSLGEDIRNMIEYKRNKTN
jgi:hypothetical protein